MSRAPGPAVVLVNWNGRRDCEGVLASIRRQRLAPAEVVVIDNGSLDGSLEWFRAQPDVVVIANPTNAGFARAANQGVAATSADLVLLCNLDVRLHEGFLEAAVARMATSPDTGSVGGLLLSEADPGVVDSAGHVLHRSGWVANRCQGQAARGMEVAEVFGVTAAAALYRREMLEDVALDGEVFCEAFFAYLEDVDLDWRARWRGWRSFFEPSALATHRRGGSGLHRSRLIERHVLANRAHLWLRNAPTCWLVGWPAVSASGLVLLRTGLAARRHPLAALGVLDAARRMPLTLGERRRILGRRRISEAELERWARPTPWGELLAKHLG